MEPQALAGVFAGLTIALALILAYVLATRSRAAAEVRREREVDLTYHRDSETALRERAEEERAQAHRWRGDLILEQRLRESAERRLEEVELDLARRRLGPVVEGESVALTTPGDRTIRGVVRQTFDDGAVLLGAATVYLERVGRGGEVEVEELDAGDVVVPAYRWAQKLPPAATRED